MEEENFRIFNNYKELINASKENKGSIVNRKINNDWTETENLREAINWQNYLIEQELFDPVDYFCSEYMKDYNFYINNPKLEIVFKENPSLKDPKSCI